MTIGDKTITHASLLRAAAGAMFILASGSIGSAQEAGDAGPSVGQAPDKISPNFADRIAHDQKASGGTTEASPPPEQPAEPPKEHRFGVPLPGK